MTTIFLTTLLSLLQQDWQILGPIALIFVFTLLWGLHTWRRLQHERTQFQERMDLLIKKTQHNQPIDLESLSREESAILQDILVSTEQSAGKTLVPLRHQRRVLIQKTPFELKPPGRWGFIAPTLLTMMGIWGTFLGIHSGLGQSKIARSQSTESLLQSSHQLFRGMETAFVTSLWGMGAAILVMGMVVFLHHRFQRNKTAMTHLLQTYFLQESSTIHLVGISKKLGDALIKQEESIQSLKQNFSQQTALLKTLQQAVAQQNEAILSTKQSISQQLAQHPSQEAIDNRLQLFIAELMVQMDETKQREEQLREMEPLHPDKRTHL